MTPVAKKNAPTGQGSMITVLLAEDHTLVREGLKAILEAEGQIEVVGQAENGREAVHLAQKLRPSVIVMDIAMPLLNGLEATRQILKVSPAARIILLSAHSNQAYVERAVELGAKGYLLKRNSLETVAKMIREVYEGRTAFTLPGAEKPARDAAHKGPKEKALLTSREAEVLQLVAEGQTNKQIGDGLCLSAKTIEKHRQNLMQKLKIHDTAGLTRYAISQGIIESDVPLTFL